MDRDSLNFDSFFLFGAMEIIEKSHYSFWLVVLIFFWSELIRAAKK